LQYCGECKQYVEPDQSQAECARRHDCAIERCPLRHLFAAAAEPEGKSPGAEGNPARPS
jgi:hypothetical protein